MKNFMSKLATFQKRWRTYVLFILLAASSQTACSHGAATNNSTMAANIYTELARHYWKNGYPVLAKERLQLALEQDPTYAPALALQKLWH